MNRPTDNTCALRLRFIQTHPLFTLSCQRLEEIAYIMNLEEKLGISRDLIYAAALLHDIGKVQQYESGIPHEIAGRKLASQILADMPEEIAFTKEEKLQILAAILGHRNLKDNAGPLETLLYKGDKMSRACFACQAEAECNWSDEKKNMEIQL